MRGFPAFPRFSTRRLRTVALGTLLAFRGSCYAQATIPAASDGAPAAKPVSIAVDLAKPVGPYTPIDRWFGYDEGNYTTTPAGQLLLGKLRDLSPVPVYIRAHHLLTSGNGVPELKWSSTNVYSEDASGRPVYDFTLLDGIFDAYRAAGVRPMVELGFMPQDLAATLPGAPRPYQVHFPGNVLAGSSNNPPKDYAKWGELARAVTAHLVQRYGRDAVRQWYFEVWNEPDIEYWHGTPEEYWKLYDYAVAGVRAALPEARVGGPASTSPRAPRAYGFLQGFLQHVVNGRSAANGGPVPLDFISFHAKGQPRVMGSGVVMGLNAELQDVDRGFQLVSSFPRLRNLPIILSEADPEGCAACSSKMNPANNYRNGTLYPSYTAAAYKRLFQLADKYKVNLLGMLSWSFEFEGRDYFEGFRSLSTNGVDKPVLNLFRMSGLMAGTRVAVNSSGGVALETVLHDGVRGDAEVDAFATRTSHAAAIMLWNYQDSSSPGPTVPVTIAVHGLPADARHILVSQYRIDDTHSNAYTVWKAMGSPQNPTPAQSAELQARAGLELLTSPVWVSATDGALPLPAAMPSHSVSLFTISW